VRLGFPDQFFLVDRRFEAMPQRAFRAFVELLEQARLPGIPEFRIRAAHVRHGQDIQVIQVRLVADLPGKGMDDVRIADVLFLRGDRQDQMVAHQPGDETRFVASEPLFQAEGLASTAPNSE